MSCRPPFDTFKLQGKPPNLQRGHKIFIKFLIKKIIGLGGWGGILFRRNLENLLTRY